MSAPAFTPGPWTVHAESEYSISRTTSVYICTAQGWPEGQLARVNTMDGLDEREANAHLIAAAPQLYEALDHLELYLRETAHHNAPQTAFARKALKLARGESQ